MNRSGIDSRVRVTGVCGTVALIVLSACTALNGPHEESDFSVVREGMRQDEITARLGPPTWSFQVRQESMTILNYRYNRADCQIYQISVLPTGLVRSAGIAQDPACDHGTRD